MPFYVSLCGVPFSHKVRRQAIPWGEVQFSFDGPENLAGMAFWVASLAFFRLPLGQVGRSRGKLLLRIPLLPECIAG